MATKRLIVNRDKKVTCNDICDSNIAMSMKSSKKRYSGLATVHTPPS